MRLVNSDDTPLIAANTSGCFDDSFGYAKRKVKTMRKIKIAQIGTSLSSHGNLIWKSIIKQKDIFDVVGYAMPEGEREKIPKHVAAFDGYREMTVEEILSDPEIEAVTIETEEIYLTKYAQMAAEAGKQIHQEKPGGIVYADFEKLIKTVKDKGLVFHLGYMYRYNPYVEETIRRVKAGELGDIFTVEAHMDGAHPIVPRQWLEAFPGGMMFFLGCHLVDLIMQIMGEPENVLPLNRTTGKDGITSDDLGMAVLEYKNGVGIAKTSANEMGGFIRRHLWVAGTKGSILLQPIENPVEGGLNAVKREYLDVKNYWGDVEPSSCDTFDRYDGMMAAFASYVRGDKQNPYTYDYELSLYKAVLRSCGVEV